MSTASQRCRQAPDDDIIDDGIVPAQAEVRLSLTVHGALIIEQSDALGSEPATIVVRAENLDLFTDILARLCGAQWPRYCDAKTHEIEQADAPPTAPDDRPRDATAAERQRRYRERKRNHDNGDESGAATTVNSEAAE